MPKLSTKHDDRAQSARFIKLAREVGAIGKPGDLARVVRKIATAERAAPTPKKAKR